MRDLPPLSSLKAFDAVARLGSVGRAADELGRTHGAVSKQLRTLQEHLGASLFDKAGTGLKLNTRGVELAQVVGQALDRLGDGYARLAAEARAPSVHVACSATFAMRWLAPHLAGFSRAHPEVRVRLSMTSAREMLSEDADLVIAWDRRAYSAEDRARAIPLGEVRFGPVCAPGYPLQMVGRGVARAPSRIVHDFTTSAWDDWTALSDVRIEGAKDLSFPHTHLCLEVAMQGLGVALIERRLVTQELASGRLTAPYGFIAFREGLAAIPTARRPLPRGAKVFLDWLAQELARDG